MTDWSKVRNDLTTQKARETQQLRFSPTDLGAAANPFSVAVQSALWSYPGLFGVEPPRSLQAAQAAHPLAALGGELVAPLTAYPKAAKLATKIPQVGKTLKRIEKGVDFAPARGFLQESARLAPVEAARLGISQTLGPALAEGLGTTHTGLGSDLTRSAIEIGAAGVLGGAFRSAQAFGRRTKVVPELEPGATADDPLQLRLRASEDAVQKGIVQADKLDEVLARQAELRQQIRMESLEGRDQKYARVRDINRLFTTGAQTRNVSKLPPVVSQALDKPTLTEIERIARLPEGWEKNARFPRVLKANNLQGAKDFNRAAGKMERVADNAWIYRDRLLDGSQSGMFSILRKVQGTPGKPGKDDLYLTLQTDNPGLFLPENQKYLGKVLDHSTWFENLPKLEPVGAELFDSAVSLRSALRPKDFRGLGEANRGGLGRLTDELMERTGAKFLADETKGLRRSMADFGRKNLQVAMLQAKHPSARVILTVGRSTMDKVQELTDRALFGRTHVDMSQPFRGFAGSPKVGEGSFADLKTQVEKNPVEWAKVWRTIKERMSPEEAAEELALENTTLRLLKEMKRQEEIAWGERAAAAKAAGKSMPKRIENHYGMPHVWKGDQRVPVYDENGKLVHVGSGLDVRTAQQEAQRVVDAASREGKKWSTRPAQRRDFKADEDLLVQLGRSKKQMDTVEFEKNRKLVTAKRRTGVGGFVGEDKPWTPKEFMEIYTRHLKGQYRLAADTTLQRVTARDRARLAKDNPGEASMVNQRLNQMLGEQGEIGKLINKHVDRVLGPVLGADSASKIVGNLNKFQFQITLGFLKTGYLMANVLTFMQTSLPHMMWLRGAAPEHIQELYSYYPVNGRSLQHSVGVMDVMKLTGRSFKELGRPGPELQAALERGMTDGTLSPRMLEEWVGESSRSVLNFKEVLQGKAPVSGFIRALAEWAPSYSERFARGHSFTMGHMMGRDFLGLRGESLYRFAKEFTEKTQFMYSAADRPMVMTGPLGSAFGLFKNWMAHYVAWMMEYADQGIKHGNWAGLTWMMGGSAALGGIGGVGPLTYMADRASRMFTDQSLMQNTYEYFDQKTADTVYYGLPAMLGFSLQGQVQVPFTDPGRDAAYMFQLPVVGMVNNASRAVGDAWDGYVGKGQNPLEDRNVVMGLARAFTPTNLYRATQIEGDRILSTQSGYPIVDRMGPGAKAMYLLGVNPLEVEKQYAVSGELYKSQQKMREAVARFGEAWAEAKMAGDYRLQRDVLQRAMAVGVPTDSVLKSGASRVAKMEEDMIERQYSLEERGAYRDIIR